MRSWTVIAGLWLWFITQSQCLSKAVFRAVADAAALLTVLAGPDPADQVTQPDAGPRLNYSSFPTDTDRVAARIGVFRQCFNSPTTDPEVRAVTERALGLGKQEEAVVVDPFAIPGYTELEKNLWCGDFQSRSECLLNVASECAMPRPACDRRFRSLSAIHSGRDSCCGCASQRARPTSSLPRCLLRRAEDYLPQCIIIVAAMEKNRLGAVMCPTLSGVQRIYFLSLRI